MEAESDFHHYDGTTLYDTTAVILPSVLLISLSLHCSFVLNFKSKLKIFIFEFICLVVPVISYLTLLADYVDRIIVFLTVCCISSYCTLKPRNENLQKNTLSKTYHSFITNSRATINLYTAIAILAVDFKIFPRRFAKTKTYGYSLMDFGVGLFVYSNGIVVPFSSKRSTLNMLKSVIPLFVLGIGRFIITNEINYSVPYSEYGIHWNFFITLAVTKVLCHVVCAFVNQKYLAISGIVLLITHEIILQMGLGEFVLSNVPRTTFILANREGIVSSVGYVSLHLLSISCGWFIQVKQKTGKYSLFFNQLAVSFAALIATLVLQKYFGVSRRLANSAYCCCILFVGILMTNLFYLNEVLLHNMYGHTTYSVPFILNAINVNGLPFFLVSNILTGIVNIVIQTQNVPDIHSFLIICSYMLLTCSISCVMYSKGLKIKL